MNSPSDWYRVESGRNTNLVFMEANGETVARTGEEKRIATFGLGGCTAVAVAGQLGDGSRKGYVQHYSPSGRDLSILALARSANLFATQGAKLVRAVVMTPGEWVKGSDEKWTMVPQEEPLVETLTRTIEDAIDDAQVGVYPYSMSMSGSYGEGTLSVALLGTGEIQVLAESIPQRFS